eukprot:gene3189-3467_t
MAQHCGHVFEQLGKDLEDLEAKQQQLSDKLIQLTQSAADLPAIEQTSLTLAALQAEYEEKEERWLVLAEIAGDI